ncbi:MAG: BrnT family toxin [Thermosynechococcaceae cyanobacterium]
MHIIYAQEIEWDPNKAASNLQKHGVSFSDAEAVLFDPNALSFEDETAQGEQRFVVIGMDHLWRLLVVVYTDRGNRVRLISARPATRSERRQYESGI